MNERTRIESLPQGVRRAEQDGIDAYVSNPTTLTLMHCSTRKAPYAQWAAGKENTRLFQKIWLVLLLTGLLFSCSDDDSNPAPDFQPPAPAGFRHANARVNGINLHYVTGGQGDPVVLLHGFPQTWYEWNRIMPALGQRYTVIVPDLRGGGLSDKPVAANGYDKKLLAEDIHQLVQQLGHSRIKLVGHDIGLMVAYAYASLYPGEVDKLVVLDAPLPGIEPIWSLINQDPRSEHFRSYQQPGYEQTYVGQERQKLTEFYQRFSADGQVPFTGEELDVFVEAYTGAENLRGGFAWYRGFPTDIVDFGRFSQTKLTMPVLALGGAQASGPIMVPMMQQVALNVTGGSVDGLIPDSGHWVVEENPEVLLRELLAFFAQ